MFNPELSGSLADLNWILFVSFGIWFTLMCLIKMLATAIQSNLPDEDGYEMQGEKPARFLGFLWKRKPK